MHVLLLILALTGLVVMISFRFGSRRNVVAAGVTDNSSIEAFVTEHQFDAMVLDTSCQTPVMVDFYADSCKPCKAFSPVLSAMVREYGGAFLLAKIDVEKNKALVQKYQVESMPTVLLFRDRECIHRFSGSKQPHSLRYILATNDIVKKEAAET